MSSSLKSSSSLLAPTSVSHSIRTLPSMHHSSYSSCLKLFLPQTLSPEVREPKTRPVVQPCSPARIFVLTICSWTQSWRESEGGFHVKQNRAKRFSQALATQTPRSVSHPAYLLGSVVQRLWPLGLFSEDARHARLSTGTRLPSWSHMGSQAGVWGNMDEEVVRLGTSSHAE